MRLKDSDPLPLGRIAVAIAVAEMMGGKGESLDKESEANEAAKENVEAAKEKKAQLP